MPIYEYKCEGCSEVFEVFQKVSDPPPVNHTCGSTQLHRVLSNTSFVLKGTGWYATDYARKDNGGPGGKGKKSRDEGGETSSSTSESKAPASGDKPASGGKAGGEGGSGDGGAKAS